MKQGLFNNVELGRIELSQESIAFQDKTFGEALVSYFDKLLVSSKNVLEFSNNVNQKELTDIVKKHTNMQVYFRMKIDNTYPLYAGIFIPQLRKDNILFSYKDIENRPGNKLREIISHLKYKKNEVDLKTGKVFGLFEHLPAGINIDPRMIYELKLNSRSITSIVLHELGHLFTYFEFIDRNTTTNQLLACLSSDLSEVKDTGDRTLLVKEIIAQLNLANTNPEELAKMNDETVIISLMKEIENKQYSLMGNLHYDQTAAESLADQYVIRHGFAKELAISLELNGLENNLKASTLRNMAYLSFGLQVSGVVISAGLLSPILVLLFSLISVKTICLAKTTNGSFTYDTLPTRLKRIREDLIQMSRKSNLTKEDINYILSGVQDIGEIIDKLDSSISFLTKIADFFSTDSGKVADSIKTQRQLEELASNDLFISALKLKTLS